MKFLVILALFDEETKCFKETTCSGAICLFFNREKNFGGNENSNQSKCIVSSSPLISFLLLGKYYISSSETSYSASFFSLQVRAPPRGNFRFVSSSFRRLPLSQTPSLPLLSNLRNIIHILIIFRDKKCRRRQ